MFELHNTRNSFSIGNYDDTMQHPQPLNNPVICTPQDSQRVLVHWNHTATGPIQGTRNTTAETKPDEVEDGDDDDENRPFTPPPPRERLSYTRYQLELLNGIYEKVRYPNSTQKQLIAKRVGITREQVKIWFQNRRRKDVVGSVTKANIHKEDINVTSTIGIISTVYESQNTSLVADGTEKGLSEGINSSKDGEESVVPTVVMKSIIDELIKFTEDPLKGKKNRKKSKKTRNKDKVTQKKAVTTMLLAGNYDMISPPNQITPTAFGNKLNAGFHHSKQSSAFECPRGSLKPAQISKISSTCENITGPFSNGVGNIGTIQMPVNHSVIPCLGVTGTSHPFGFNSRLPSSTLTGCLGSDIPVLRELLSHKSPTEKMSSANNSIINSTQVTVSRSHEYEKSYARPGIISQPFRQNRPLNGIYPYPFLADQPVILSSLRQPEHIFRPSPHYPLPHYSDDPYQPLFITSLPNPYYSPPSASWQGSNTNNSTTYTQL